MQTFLTIYTHELKQWFRRPSFYIYLVIMAFIAMTATGASAGLFSNVNMPMTGPVVNSPIAIIRVFITTTILLLFLLPSIIGLTIHRDYKSKMDALLYSYPFSKAQYLLGKFLSGYTLVVLIIFAMTLAMMIGYRLPSTNASIGPMRIDAYLYTNMVYILPNMFFYGVFIFTIVTFSRNMTAGFIGIIILMFVLTLLNQLVTKIDNKIIAALISPSGIFALDYYTKDFVFADKSDLALPLGKLIIYNRLLWLAITGLIGFFIYKAFSFSSTPPSLNIFKRKGERVTKRNFGGITRINLPKFEHDYSFLANIKTTWRLSNIDFKYILKSIPFIVLLFFGQIIMIIAFSTAGRMGLGGEFQSTAKMLKVGYGAISLSIIITTFLYAGMLVNRASSNMANFLIDATPIRNWMLWLSQLIAIFKVQLMILTTVMLAGVSFQLYKGQYDLEIGHYLFELYVLKFSSLMVMAILALFVQSIIRNSLLGVFLLFLLYMTIPLLMFMDVQHPVFQLNKDTSYMYINNEYTGLKDFFLYRLYWIFFGFVLLGLAHLFWVRGLLSGAKERLTTFKERLDKKMIVVLAVPLCIFIVLGAYLYNKDSVVKDTNATSYRNEY